jgi:hypothetical protein
MKKIGRVKDKKLIHLLVDNLIKKLKISIQITLIHLNNMNNFYKILIKMNINHNLFISEKQ